MASPWVCIACLLTLRGEFNTISPNRDKGADGTIGNSLHTSSSDHTPDEDSRVLRDHDGDSKNEVHALDIDSSGPWPGSGTQKQRFHRLFMRIIAGEKAKWLDDKDMCRLNYAIWDRKIYDKDNDFEPRDYYGSDPHTNHAHFSGRYETRAENDTRPWGVYVPPTVPKPLPVESEEDLPVNQAEFNKLFLGAMKDPTIREQVGQAVVNAKIGGVVVPDRTLGDAARDFANGLRAALWFPADHKEAKGANVLPGSPLASMIEKAVTPPPSDI